MTDENGKMFSKRVENTVVKEEIAHYEQFLLFPQRFKRLVLQTVKTGACLGKGKNIIVICHAPSCS